MGKKAAKRGPKKIPAEDEEASEEVVQEKPKKGSAKAAFDLKDVLSESFRGMLSQYISLNEEVMTLKGAA